MGHINVPKLIGGSQPEYREMPSDWNYYTSLKSSADDQAYLFFKGNSNAFAIGGMSSGTYSVILYGGSNGTTPLYKFTYSNSYSNRLWYHWDSVNQTWVQNTTQPTLTQVSNCNLTYGDLDNYPLPRGLRLTDLTGKTVTNDPHIGTTELFTVIVHKENGVAQSHIVFDGFEGTDGTGCHYSTPLIAYSGNSKGCRISTPNDNVIDLEFVELTGGTNTNSYQFYQMDWLHKVVLPNTVTSLGSAIFKDSYGIKEIEFSSGLTKIPSETCSGCVNLKNITLKEGLTEIEYFAFQNCEALENITLPSTLTTLNFNVFYNCYNLSSINLPNSLETIGDSCFANDKKLEEIVIPEYVSSSGFNTFQYCTSLKKVTLSPQCPTITTYQFNECFSLTEIVNFDLIESIDTGGLQGCHSLGSLTFENPDFWFLGNDALHGCANSLYFKFYATTPPMLADSSAFASCNSYMKILIPYDSITDYQYDTNWSSTMNQIAERQRGFGYFYANDTLPATTTDGTYTLTWFENLDDVIATSASGVPTVTPITVAPADGEYYCTFVEVT